MGKLQLFIFAIMVLVIAVFAKHCHDISDDEMITDRIKSDSLNKLDSVMKIDTMKTDSVFKMDSIEIDKCK